jgi:hypothetical protein
MALSVLRRIANVPLVAHVGLVPRCASTQTLRGDVETRPAAVRHVLISQYNDLTANLALEEWLYRNHDLNHKVRYRVRYALHPVSTVRGIQ